jgi:hypothetical protein
MNEVEVNPIGTQSTQRSFNGAGYVISRSTAIVRTVTGREVRLTGDYHLVATIVDQLSEYLSDRPFWYTFAQSKRVIPASRHR